MHTHLQLHMRIFMKLKPLLNKKGKFFFKENVPFYRKKLD